MFQDIEKRHVRRRKTGDPAHWWQRAEYSESVLVATLGGITVAVANARVCEGYGGFTVNLESAG